MPKDASAPSPMFISRSIVAIDPRLGMNANKKNATEYNRQIHKQNYCQRNRILSFDNVSLVIRWSSYHFNTPI
jgi:hypothetical protein